MRTHVIASFVDIVLVGSRFVWSRQHDEEENKNGTMNIEYVGSYAAFTHKSIFRHSTARRGNQ